MTSKIDAASAPAIKSASAGAALAPQAGAIATTVSATVAVDKVSLSGDAMRMQQIDKAVAQEPADGIDATRVANVRSALAAGTYKVDSNRVADKLARLEWDMAGQ